MWGLYSEDRNAHSEIRQKNKGWAHHDAPGGPTCSVCEFLAQFRGILEPNVRTVVAHVDAVCAIAEGGRQDDNRDFRQ